MDTGRAPRRWTRPTRRDNTARLLADLHLRQINSSSGPPDPDRALPGPDLARAAEYAPPPRPRRPSSPAQAVPQPTPPPLPPPPPKKPGAAAPAHKLRREQLSVQGAVPLQPETPARGVRGRRARRRRLPPRPFDPAELRLAAARRRRSREVGGERELVRPCRPPGSDADPQFPRNV